MTAVSEETLKPVTDPPVRSIRRTAVDRLRGGSKDSSVAGYLFISPFYLLFAVFALFPPIFGLYVSFFDWNGLSRPTFVGLQNYERILHSSIFWGSFANTIEIALLASVPGLVLALLVAFVLDRYVDRLRNVYLTILFTPVVASTPAIALLFQLMFDPSHGVVDNGLHAVGLPTVNWLGGTVALKFTVAILLIWRWLGYNAVIYLAGLQAVPEELYEAAAIDGAAGRHVFRHVTLPQLRPVVLFTTVLSTIGILQLFTEPYLLAGPNGGTNQTLLTMMMNMYNNAFTYFRFGYASALGMVLFVVALLGTLVNVVIGRRREAI